MAKARLAHGDVGSLFLAASVAVLGANLTMVVASMDPGRTSRTLIWSVWPGIYSAYVLTGGSNASPKQEAIAPYFEAGINALVYFVAVCALRLIWRQLMLSSLPKINDSTEQGASDDHR
jgi:hypothetical protein